MTISVNGIPVFDTNRNACVNSLYMERGIAVGSNVSLLTSPMWGESAGYVSGGTAPGGATTCIEKFSFSSTYSSSSVGALTVARSYIASQSSEQSGYNSGGFAASTYYNTIDKFPFSTNSNAIDVGDLVCSGITTDGVSSITDGYSGGRYFPGTPNIRNLIDKFPFASDSNATCIGSLSTAKEEAGSSSSLTHGYFSGGWPPSLASSGIEKFSFSSGGVASSIGYLCVCKYAMAGHSSCVSGYISGGANFGGCGFTPSCTTDWIEKFPFSTDSNSVFVGVLSCSRRNSTGISSSTNGYTAVGMIISPVNTKLSMVDRFPFATDSNASCIGSLSARGDSPAGQQVWHIQY